MKTPEVKKLTEEQHATIAANRAEAIKRATERRAKEIREEELLKEDVHVCVIPGARLPPGTHLPPHYPFAWLGHQTVSWAGVGLLVRLEVLSAVQELEGVGG